MQIAIPLPVPLWAKSIGSNTLIVERWSIGGRRTTLRDMWIRARALVPSLPPYKERYSLEQILLSMPKYG